MKLNHKQKNKFIFSWKKNFNKFNQGFTLVETMVAVFILTIALTSFLSLTSRSLFAARYARNEMTASYLLQGAVDYIRNERDSIAFQQQFSGGGWIKFLNRFGYVSATSSGPCFSTNGCYFEVNAKNPVINKCNTNPSFGTLKCPIFYYDKTASNNSNSFYNYDKSGVPSHFKRKIFLKLSSANYPYELDVTATVEWLNGNVVRSRSLHTSLLNWMGAK